MRAPTHRAGRRRRPWFLLLLGAGLCLAAAVTLATVPRERLAAGSARDDDAANPAPTIDPTTAQPSPTPDASPTPPPITYPDVGHRTYTVVPGTSAVVGTRGDLLRFRVEVETDIADLDPTAFAAQVLAIYGDAQGWTAGGRWRFQRVGAAGPVDFTVFLVTPATRDVLCDDGGYDRYTSCRNGDHVILNVARWAHAVPHYGAPLDAYRAYMVNHETGHRLGFGHELCPGAGQLAPVMQQQTLGLHGCLANSWPYPHGAAYHGQSGNYPTS
jgi:hypothetical protein